MKKLTILGVLTLVLVLVAVSVVSAAPSAGPKPGTDFNGPHYNLNVIGVPHDKLNGSFDNTSRHTIFIPLYTDWYADPCTTTGSNSNMGQAPGVVSTLPEKGVRLRIGPSGDNSFYVTDGNATNDKYAELLMPATPNGYDVYISGKGKPGGCLDLDAYWVDLGGTTTTMYFIGHVDVDRKTGQPKWQNVNWLLYGSGGVAYFADPYDTYFWQLYNNGLRLMQVRFYPN